MGPIYLGGGSGGGATWSSVGIGLFVIPMAIEPGAKSEVNGRGRVDSL